VRPSGPSGLSEPWGQTGPGDTTRRGRSAARGSRSTGIPLQSTICRMHRFRQRAVPRLLLSLCLLATCTACGDGDAGERTTLTPPPGWPSAAERTLRPGDAPTPFTADQIRAHCPSDLRILQLAETPGQEPKRTLTTFEDSTDDATTVSHAELGSRRGGMQPSLSERQSWTALQAQTSSAAAETEITEETITTQLGTFKCMLYVVTRTVAKERADTRMLEDPQGRDGPQDEIIEDRMWYAYDLPGPPVRWVRSADGDVLFALNQIERTHGTAGEKKDGAK